MNRQNIQFQYMICFDCSALLDNHCLVRTFPIVLPSTPRSKIEKLRARHASGLPITSHPLNQNAPNSEDSIRSAYQLQGKQLNNSHTLDLKTEREGDNAEANFRQSSNLDLIPLRFHALPVSGSA